MKKDAATPRNKCRRLVWLIGLAAPLFVAFFRSVTLAQKLTLSICSDSSVPTTTATTTTDFPNIPAKRAHRRLAVATFLDKPVHMYGTYAIKQQMDKFNMSQAGVALVVVVPTSFPEENQKLWEILNQWVPSEHLYQVDREYIIDKLNGGLWRGTFNKLWLFNLTNYDTAIILDQDIHIRTSLMHWFDFPTPCATQKFDSFEWNSGAMVISPSTAVFDELIELLPRVTAHEGNGTHDNLNSGFGQQGFLSSFFTQADHPSLRMKTMGKEASVLSSEIRKGTFDYFLNHRDHIIETIHLTTMKPWLTRTVTRNGRLCTVLREWAESVKGYQEAGLGPLPDYTRDCSNLNNGNEFLA